MGLALLVALAPTLLLIHQLDGVYGNDHEQRAGARPRTRGTARALAAGGIGLALGALYVVVSDRLKHPSRAQVRITRIAMCLALSVGVVVLVSAYSPTRLAHEAWGSFKSSEANTGTAHLGSTASAATVTTSGGSRSRQRQIIRSSASAPETSRRNTCSVDTARSNRSTHTASR